MALEWVPSNATTYHLTKGIVITVYSPAPYAVSIAPLKRASFIIAETGSRTLMRAKPAMMVTFPPEMAVRLNVRWSRGGPEPVWTGLVRGIQR